MAAAKFAARCAALATAVEGLQAGTDERATPAATPTDASALRAEAAALLEEEAPKFRERLTQRDPVTGEARYGERMRERVQTALDCLARAVEMLDAMQGEEGGEGNQAQAQAQEQEQEEAREREERMRKQREEEEQERERLAALAAAEAQAKREREAAEERERKRKREEEAVQADALRRRRREEKEREEENKREARRERLHERRRMEEEAVKQGATACLDTVQNEEVLRHLLALFDRICSHPDDALCRTLKLGNPLFHEHIGHDPAAIRTLLATGFRFQTRPVAAGGQGQSEPPGLVPSGGESKGGSPPNGGDDNETDAEEELLVMREPSVEDLDGWSAWFDTLKAIRNVLREKLGVEG